MLRKQQGLTDLSLDELAERAGDTNPEALLAHAFKMEFMKRQTECQQEAARAAKETAEATKRTARNVLWSVIAIAVTSGLSAIFAFLNWYGSH